MEKTDTQYIDMTPTWVEWANMFFSLSVSGERKAITSMRDDLTKMAVAADAINAMLKDNPDLKDKFIEALAKAFGYENSKELTKAKAQSFFKQM